MDRTQVAKQTPRESLFDGLHDGGWIAPLGFAQEEMDVLGHNDVADRDKMVTPAYLLQHFKEQMVLERPPCERVDFDLCEARVGRGGGRMRSARNKT